MPMTHNQKADVANRYVAVIKRRIELRKAAQTQALKEVRELGSLTVHPAIEKIVARIKKRHGITGQIIKVKVDERARWNGEYCNHLCVRDESVSVMMPADSVPGLNEAIEEMRRPERKARELCVEISFLTECLSSSRIACFSAYVGRLWAPAKADEIMPDTRLAPLIDDFLTSIRPATCKTA